MCSEKTDARLRRFRDYFRVRPDPRFRIRFRNAVSAQLSGSLFRNRERGVPRKEKAGLRAQQEQAGGEWIAKMRQ
jgi:hypothetical protein